MRKVVLSMYLSADGVVENPTWTMAYWSDEIARFKLDEIFASDTLLLGRVTYEGFASAWPDRADEAGFAERINRLPKVVPSRTLESAGWNARLVRDDIAGEVARLKQQPGQDILIYGSVELVQSLVRHNLIDEYRLLIYPLVLGSGKRLFPEGTAVPLRLAESRTFDTGVVALTYQPAPAA